MSLVDQINSLASRMATEFKSVRTAIATKVDKSTTISAGTGLTGGGALDSNQSLAVNFGTTAGTVTQGNDSRLSNARTPTAHTHLWADITDKPSTFTPSAHTHTKSQITDFAHTHVITDLPVAASGVSNATSLVRADDSRLSNSRTPTSHTHLWADITDKPSTFTPSTHTHTKAQISDFAHSHLITDLPVAASGVSSATALVRADDARLSNNRTPVAHSHVWADIVGLQTAMDDKVGIATNETITGVKTFSITPGLTAYPNGYMSPSLMTAPDSRTMWDWARFRIPTIETSPDGVTWTATTTPKGLFAGLNPVVQHWFTSTTRFIRFTWGASQYNQVSWLKAAFAYNAGTQPDIIVTGESSPDGTTWGQRFQGTWDSVYYGYWGMTAVQPLGGDPSYRITMEAVNTGSWTGNLAGLISLELQATRPDYGAGNANYFPYSWDADKNVNFPAALTRGGQAVVTTNDSRLDTGLWTPLLTNVTELSPTRFTKSGGGTAWNGYVSSIEGYVESAEASFSPDHADVRVMVGLTSDPTASTSYSTIDYAWYADGGSGNNWSIYENGSQVLVVSPAVSPSSSDYAQVIYDGENVKYYLNGVLRRTVARPVGADLHLAMSFYDVLSTGAKNVRFGSAGSSTLAKETLGGTTDLNTLVSNGVYRAAGSSTYVNFPAGAYTFGTLVVHATGNSVTQVYYPHNDNSAQIAAYERTKWNASDWFGWTAISKDGHVHAASEITSGTLDEARLEARLRSGSANNSIPDPNNCLTNGFFYCSNASGYLPGTTATATPDYEVIVAAYSDQWLTQIARCWRTDKTWTRARANGVWGLWVEAATAVNADNMAPNGGFDDLHPVDSTLPKYFARGGWASDASNTVAAVSVDTTAGNFETGSRSVKLTTQSAAPGLHPSFRTDYALPVEAGEAWLITVRCKASVSMGGVYVRLMNQSGGESNQAIENRTVGTAWQTLQGNFIIPSGMTTMRVFVLKHNSAVGSSLWVDRITLQHAGSSSKIILSPSAPNMVKVVYTTTLPPRPAATYVEWVGQVDPGASAAPGDTWVPTA